jgi:hypothetical protein
MSTCRRGAVRRDADVILHINRHGFIWRRSLYQTWRSTAVLVVFLDRGTVVSETARLLKVRRILGKKLESCTIWFRSTNCMHLMTCVTLIYIYIYIYCNTSNLRRTPRLKEIFGKKCSW